MPLPKGTLVEDYLEGAVRDLLRARTQGLNTQLKRWGGFKWILERESVPTPPYGKLRKASQSRFGNGLPVIRKLADGAQYREQQWRITIELYFDVATVDTEIKSSGLSTNQVRAAGIDSVINGLFNDLFMTPEGRAELSALGIDYIRLTDEGDVSTAANAAGERFSFDCQTAVWLIEPPALIAA